MLTFIDKATAWACLDEGLHGQLGWANPGIHLKTWQDMAVFRMIRDSRGLRVGEIGGGNSRILGQLAAENECCNIDKFAGSHGGPSAKPEIAGVRNVVAFLGEFSPELEDASFDVVCSVSVVEHVPDAATDAFLADMLRILKPGGLAVHAIDLYVEDRPTPGGQARLDLYGRWLDHPEVVPLAPREAVEAAFRTSMASNPDLTMWHWNRAAPALAELRARAQSVSLLLAFRKAGGAGEGPA